MAALHRHEPHIPANFKTAAANLLILRIQAAAQGRPLTSYQSTAAFRIAMEFERIVHQHAGRRTMQ
jgi:hypothetical protein